MYRTARTFLLLSSCFALVRTVSVGRYDSLSRKSFNSCFWLKIIAEVPVDLEWIRIHQLRMDRIRIHQLRMDRIRMKNWDLILIIKIINASWVNRYIRSQFNVFLWKIPEPHPCLKIRNGTRTYYFSF
jgi:hypothetical protein